jgi:NAD(P)-dependent dehydrogenase (short-subunit alcohol dehydrogenase family)
MSNPHLLIGGGGDIGQALAARLHARNERVVLAGRPSERLQAAARRFDVEPIHLDATEPQQVERVAQQAAEQFGGLASVTNLVGSILLKAAHMTSDEEFEETLRTNLYSAFGTVRAAAKTLRKTGGSVVLLSTAAARLGLPNHEAIAAAKGGVTSLALSAAATYSRYGIRVNVVAPGLVQTELAKSITSNDASRKASLSMHPLQRLGEPDDVAATIAHLLHDDSAWITGQVIGVDGGLATLKVQR